MSEQKKIQFKDISGWVKIGVIAGWCYAGLFSIGFLYGVISTIIRG